MRSSLTAVPTSTSCPDPPLLYFHTPNPIIANTARPPTIPPTIGPMLFEDPESSSSSAGSSFLSSIVFLSSSVLPSSGIPSTICAPLASVDASGRTMRGSAFRDSISIAIVSSARSKTIIASIVAVAAERSDWASRLRSKLRRHWTPLGFTESEVTNTSLIVLACLSSKPIMLLRKMGASSARGMHTCKAVKAISVLQLVTRPSG
mmetsp:Transcript_61178/g.126329  ORF Transcript_61178/g.126329 Transcript_61178/m.126329 type:complete len:205 (-) Transcript_61178:3390-4004(-)